MTPYYKLYERVLRNIRIDNYVISYTSKSQIQKSILKNNRLPSPDSRSVIRYIHLSNNSNIVDIHVFTRGKVYIVRHGVSGSCKMNKPTIDELEKKVLWFLKVL